MRLGHAIVLPPTLEVPRHILRWVAEFTRKLVKSSLGGEVYAFRGMVEHMSLLREFNANFADLAPGAIGFEDREGLYRREAREDRRRTVPDSPLSATQKSPDTGESDNVNWLPGSENPTGGLTKVQSDTVPLPRLVESGAHCPGILRPPQGISSNEGGAECAFFRLFPHFNSAIIPRILAYPDVWNSPLPLELGSGGCVCFRFFIFTAVFERIP